VEPLILFQEVYECIWRSFASNRHVVRSMAVSFQVMNWALPSARPLPMPFGLELRAERLVSSTRTLSTRRHPLPSAVLYLEHEKDRVISDPALISSFATGCWDTMMSFRPQSLYKTRAFSTDYPNLTTSPFPTYRSLFVPNRAVPLTTG
jgi:hypothetical protein